MLQSAVMYDRKTAFDPQAARFKVTISKLPQAADRDFITLPFIMACVLAVVIAHWAAVTFSFPWNAVLAILAGSSFGIVAATWPDVRIYYRIVFKKQRKKE